MILVLVLGFVCGGLFGGWMYSAHYLVAREALSLVRCVRRYRSTNNPLDEQRVEDSYITLTALLIRTGLYNHDDAI